MSRTIPVSLLLIGPFRFRVCGCCLAAAVGSQLLFLLHDHLRVAPARWQRKASGMARVLEQSYLRWQESLCLVFSATPVVEALFGHQLWPLFVLASPTVACVASVVVLGPAGGDTAPPRLCVPLQGAKSFCNPSQGRCSCILAAPRHTASSPSGLKSQGRP